MRILLLTMTFVIAGVLRLPAQKAGVELKIAIPNAAINGPEERRRPLTYDTSGKRPFYVLLTNKSDKEQRFWEDWNSWGYRNLYFELTDSKGKTWLSKRGIMSWNMNAPSWFSLLPNETHVFAVTFPDNWENLPKVERPPTVVTMRAMYEISPDPGSASSSVPQSTVYHIWIGKVISDPLKVDLYDPK